MALAPAAPVLVLSAGRPEVLAAVLDALLRQLDASILDRPVFLFQDGGRHHAGGMPAWSDAVLLDNLDLFRSRLPHGIPLPVYFHQGAALTRDRAERFAFAELAAPAAIVIDDTLLPGRRWLAALDRLIGLALDSERIGHVAASGDPRASRAAQLADASRLIARPVPAGYAVARRQWLRQRPYIEAYLRAAGEGEGSHAAVQALFRGWGVAASGTAYEAAVSHACVLTGTARLSSFASFARALAPAPSDLPGFDGAALIEDDVFRPLAPTAAELAGFLATAAAASF
jgi:hypothetical protein